MPIRFRCPAGHVLVVPTAWIGRTTACPICQTPTRVPGFRRAAMTLQRPGSAATTSGLVVNDPFTSRRRRALRPTTSQRFALHRLAVLLAVVAALGILPAAQQMRDDPSVTWARLALGVGLVQLLYVGWMVSLADWGTLRLTTWVFTLVAAGYAAAAAVLWFAEPEKFEWLELIASRRTAAGWSLALAAATTTVCIFAARRATDWRAEALRQGSEE